MLTFDETGYAAHIVELGEQWQRLLVDHGFEAAVVPAGAAEMFFQDDQVPPFHPNPHFARWFPDDNCEHCALLVRAGSVPKLYFLKAESYWYLPPALPDWAAKVFEVEFHPDTDALRDALVRDLAKLGRCVLAGPAAALDLDLPLAVVNPKDVMNDLAFARATKTPFEVARMREATAIGVRGHLAARDAFYGGGSEFDIHMAYLAASSQLESQLPYANIVALNEHTGLLHYQHYDRQPPATRHSFLIDAGARSAGYHSDITRTYSATLGDDFDALIQALDAKQQQVAASTQVGMSYIDLHSRMHLEIAELLVDFGFVTCSAESAFERKITDQFFPHGLGHLLGLQTHDVGGRLVNANGDELDPPERFPTLRYTRTIEENHVFTVEPGIYFIPMLLDELANSDAGKDVNWSKVNALRPCGGVRIEDDVLLTANGAENLTRLAFAAES